METEKKKKNFFKSKLFLFGILGLFVLAIGSAVVVNYISSTADVEIEVKSPFTSGFYDGSGVVESLILPSIYAGENFSFENRIENLASVDTNVNLEYRISNGLGDVEETDFSHVEINVRSDGLGNYHFFTGTFTELCNFAGLGHGANSCVIDNGDLVLTIPNFFWANEKAEVFADLTFDSGVQPTTYTIDATVLKR